MRWMRTRSSEWQTACGHGSQDKTCMTRRLAGYGARQVRNQQALREVCFFFGQVLSGKEALFWC